MQRFFMGSTVSVLNKYVIGTVCNAYVHDNVVKAQETLNCSYEKKIHCSVHKPLICTLVI